MANPLDDFKPGKIHLGKDGDIVKGPKQAEAIILGYVRKQGEAAKPREMATHINRMKERGTIRSHAVPSQKSPGGAQSIRMPSRNTSPMDALPGNKTKMAKGLPSNRGE